MEAKVFFANSCHSSHCKQLLSKARRKGPSQCQSLHHLASFDTSRESKKIPLRRGLMIHLIHHFYFVYVLLCLSLFCSKVNCQRTRLNSSLVHWSLNSTAESTSTSTTVTSTASVINESYPNSPWLKKASSPSTVSPGKSPASTSSVKSSVSATAGDINLKSKSSTLADALFVVPYSKGPLDPSTYQSVHSINSATSSLFPSSSSPPASPVYEEESRQSIDDATIIQPFQRDTEPGQKLSHGLQDPSLIPTSQAALFLKSASFFSPPTHWQMDISVPTAPTFTSSPSPTPFSTTATGPLVQYTSTSKSPGRTLASKAVTSSLANVDIKDQMSTSTTPKTSSTSMSMLSSSSFYSSTSKSPSVKGAHRTTITTTAAATTTTTTTTASTTANITKNHQRSINNKSKERLKKSDKISQVKVNNSTSKGKQLPSNRTNSPSPSPQLLSKILESALSSRSKSKTHKTRSNGTLSGRSFSSDDEPVLNFNSKGNFSIHNMYFPENVAIYDNLHPQSGPFTRVVNDEKLPPYKLVWADEFTDEDVDCKKWMHLVDCSGRGNNELQCYTDRTENVFIEEGILHLQTLVEDYQNRSYTSGRLHSLGPGWLYGLVEVRARLPKGKHLWPAIWMVPVNNIYGPWPRSGEIDIMEMRGQIPSSIESTVHFGASRTDRTYIGSRMIDFHTDFSAQYHIYSFEWTNSTMKWFLDGNQFYHLDLNQEFVTKKGTVVYNKHGSPFDHAYRLILNVAVGGFYFPQSVYGNLTLNDAFLWDKPSMEVDWVRVYQRSYELNSINETDVSKKKADLNSVQKVNVNNNNITDSFNSSVSANESYVTSPPSDWPSSNSSEASNSPSRSPLTPGGSNSNSSFSTVAETHEGVSSEPLTTTTSTESVTMSTESQNVTLSTLSPSPSPWPVYPTSAASNLPGASVIEPLVVDSVTLAVKEEKQVTSLPREQSHPLAPLPPNSLESLVSSTVAPSNDSSDGHIKEQSITTGNSDVKSQVEQKYPPNKISLPVAHPTKESQSVINYNFTSLPPPTDPSTSTDPVTTMTTPGIDSSSSYTSPSPSSSPSSSSSLPFLPSTASPSPSPSSSNCTTSSPCNDGSKLHQEKPNDEKKINEVINYEYDSSEEKMDSPLITYYYYQEDAR